MLRKIYTIYKENKLDRELTRHRVNMIFINYVTAA